MLLFGNKLTLLEPPVEFQLHPTHKLKGSMLLFGNKLTLLELPVEFQLYPTHTM
jgi:hypothetical protein